MLDPIFSQPLAPLLAVQVLSTQDLTDLCSKSLAAGSYESVIFLFLASDRRFRGSKYVPCMAAVQCPGYNRL